MRARFSTSAKVVTSGYGPYRGTAVSSVLTGVSSARPFSCKKVAVRKGGQMTSNSATYADARSSAVLCLGQRARAGGCGR